jgi:hypothetical protein
VPDFLVVMSVLALTYRMGSATLAVEAELPMSAPAKPARVRRDAEAAA